MLIRAAILAGIASVLAAVLWLSQRWQDPGSVSGWIEADEIRIGSLVGGRVARVDVEEGQRVARGDVLVELEPFDLAEQRAELAAQLGEARALLDLLVAGARSEEIEQARARQNELAAELERRKNGPRPQEIEAARAGVRLAQAELDLARIERRRLGELTEHDVVSRDEMDRVVTAERVAEARLAARESELGLLEEGTRPEEIVAAEARREEAQHALELLESGSREEEIAAARAVVASAEARLAALEQRARELQVRAPLDALVEAVDLRPGDLVPANAPVVALLDPSHLWVRAYVPEDRLGLEIGAPVWVSVDSFPGERFRGRLSFVAREAEFTPSNVQTPEERSKMVFRVRVELEEGVQRLRAGMSADLDFGDGP